MATQKRNPEAGDSQRHTPYPYYSLQKAIEVGDVVKELGGTNGDVEKSLIAHQLEMDEGAPTLIGIIGAAKLYNVIEGRGAYRLSELAKKYFYPTNPSERQASLAQMASSPPLFAALIEKFDGTRLPTAEVLVNILHREHHIAASWQTRAVSLFLSSLRDAQLVDAAGFLRYRASLHAAAKSTSLNGNTSAEPSGVQLDTVPTQPQPQSPLSDEHVSSWSYRGIRLVTPAQMTSELWKKLSDYVNVLKPDGDSKE